MASLIRRDAPRAPRQAASAALARREIDGKIAARFAAPQTGAGMLYFEDIAAGQKFRSPSLRIDADAIIAFAAEFDPQPFHLDDAAARRTIFEGLAASGWHTAALTMKLCLASDFRPVSGILGVGGELTWRKPVRPGDELHVEIDILETRPSRSRPGQGLVKLHITTLNQAGEPVQTFTPTLFIDRRPDAG